MLLVLLPIFAFVWLAAFPFLKLCNGLASAWNTLPSSSSRPGPLLTVLARSDK